MRWTGVNRTRAITGAIAGASMLLVALVLILLEAPPYLGWLPPSIPLLVAATVGIAAWRAEEAVATRSPLRWAWGSAWRAWLGAAIGVGIVMTVWFGQAAVDRAAGLTPDATPSGSIGYQVGLLSQMFTAPAALLVGTVSHLAAAIAARRAARHRWRWFAP